MDSASTAPIVQPAKPRRGRWWRAAISFFAILVLTPLAIFSYMTWATRQDWTAAEAEVTALDPRWRLHEIEEDRARIPDAENSAPKINAIALRIWGLRLFRSPNFEKVFENLPPTAKL